MSKYTTLIVGAAFRPPAKQILAHLASGASLRLEEENDNTYDAGAVKVLLDTHQIPESQYEVLAEKLPDAGCTLEQVMSSGPVFLGYIPAQEGGPLRKARVAEPELIGNMQVRELAFGPTGHPVEDCKCFLGFGVDGSPRLVIESP